MKFFLLWRIDQIGPVALRLGPMDMTNENAVRYFCLGCTKKQGFWIDLSGNSIDKNTTEVIALKVLRLDVVVSRQTYTTVFLIRVKTRKVLPDERKRAPQLSVVPSFWTYYIGYV